MTTTTFADYAAGAEARKDIELAVLKHTLALCEALKQNFIEYSIKSHQRFLERLKDISDAEESYHLTCIEDLKNGNCDYDFTIESGRKYHKVIMHTENQRYAHAFVDKKTGEVYKSASWKSPARGVRYDLRLIEEREWLFENADWSGGYLYK
jgi:hypothetical protein